MNKFIRSAKLPRGAYSKSLGEAVSPYVSPGDGRLDWNALRFNVCPKCHKPIVQGLKVEDMIGDFDHMMIHQCGFMIRESKYRKIVSSQTSSKLEEDSETDA